MDLGRPYAVFTGSSLEGDVLAVLTGTDKPLTGRQIARMTEHGSDRGVRLALNRLAEHGLVDVVRAPPSLLFALNRDHIAAPVALALGQLRIAFYDRLREAFTHWPVPPAHASVFGSFARGDGDLTSDIDVLLVRPAAFRDEAIWDGNVAVLGELIDRWTGNRAGFAEIEAADIGRLVTERAPILEALKRDSVTVLGPNVLTLLSGASR